MKETFNEISNAVACSAGNINMHITGSGTITGRGVASTPAAISACGGNLDNILRSFGGIQGAGNQSVFQKALSAIDWAKKGAGSLEKGLERKIHRMETFGEKVKELSKKIQDKDVVKDLDLQVSKLAKAIKDAKALLTKPEELKRQCEQATEAVKTMSGSGGSNEITAGSISLGISSVNKLGGVKEEMCPVVKTMRAIKDGIKRILEEYLEHAGGDKEDVKEFVEYEDKKRAERQGGDVDAGALNTVTTSTEHLADRLREHRDTLRTSVNKFVAAFGSKLDMLVSTLDNMSEQLGKKIDYDEKTLVFFDTFSRMKEFVDSTERNTKLYQYLLELNQNMQIDSKEVKERFLSLVRDLSERALALDQTSETKLFAKVCLDLITTVNEGNDEIRNLYDTMRKSGGSVESMNELFSVDSSKINIVGMLNALEKMKVAVKKVEFYRNIAVFRTNLNQTNKEIASYSKDYTKSVGKTIGEAISKIQSEYTEIINNINDNKAGMGLEIDMYNEARNSNDKISKEKLKLIYKWQCDARIGLYKTVEAIDLYLLHFTETVTKNPDAVADLQKLLSATRVIAKWYDVSAGDNVIRVFETLAKNSVGAPVDDAIIDAPDFVEKKYKSVNEKPSSFLIERVGGERAAKLYERCRRAVEGVVVLKNIISYFITISEKYGNLKSEKNILMAPSNIYKNLVNYIWVSALETNASGLEVLTETNDLKRIVTYKDTEVGIAQADRVDPDLLGINFNRHSIDKLRILKCHADLQNLRDVIPSLNINTMQRIVQFVVTLFGRIGNTKYIFEMFKFGVVDLSLVKDELLEDFMKFIKVFMAEMNAQQASLARISGNRVASLVYKTEIAVNGTKTSITALSEDAAITAAVEAIKAVAIEFRNKNVRFSVMATNDAVGQLIRRVVSLDEFKNIATIADFDDLLVMRGMNEDPSIYRTQIDNGFLQGLLYGLTGMSTTGSEIQRATTVVNVLNHLLVRMIDAHRRENTVSIFAIDDTYFMLTIKAIAGKVMSVAGISAMFKNPSSSHNAITKSPTRLIMGGADGDEVIEGAIELYVRLPLLVEFYRRVFDNGNKKFRDLSEQDNLDNEQISLVPEVGNIWSGILINIFDKSKHIDSGIYTQDNMRKIVAEVNAIYKHYKNKVPEDQLTRHVITELVAEINRRYGVIKRNELLTYYRVMNATTQESVNIAESNYVNNDLDILNESLEFEGDLPSDEYVEELKKTLKDKTVETEVKINKLTDYKIVKDFRERITSVLNDVYTKRRAGEQVLSIRERIRHLKRAIIDNKSRDEKYAMIIKAIEESEAINQSSNDIYMCFHEFVIAPLRTLAQMHSAVKLFILNVYAVIGCADANDLIRLSPEDKELFRKLKPLLYEEREALFNNGRLKAIPSSLMSEQIAVVSRIGEMTFVRINAFSQTKVFAMLSHLFLQMSSCAGDLVKLQITSTQNVVIDFSNFQTVCEHLIANVKYMIDKFTGLVPDLLIKKATARDTPDSIYNIEESLLLKIFNKQNKSESSRDILCIDNLYMYLPVVSTLMIKPSIMPAVKSILDRIIMQGFEKDIKGILDTATMPVIRDAFMRYDKTTGMYITPRSGDSYPFTYVSNLLFNPRPTSTLVASQAYTGLIQEFNIILSQYLHGIYDVQNKKIYTKAFGSYAANALNDAMNGQCIKDFHCTTTPTAAAIGPVIPGQPIASEEFIEDANVALRVFRHHCPRTPTVLSATLAYTMKCLINRVHPVSGAKLHELSTMQEISPHMLEKYRMLIPMFIRICTAFLDRCQKMRKILGHLDISGGPGVFAQNIVNMTTIVKENVRDAEIDFAASYKTLQGVSYDNAVDLVPLYVDEIISSIGALLDDMKSVQKELLETDTTTPLYFDLKKDFTKNYLEHNKSLPFAPLSILTTCFPNVAPTQALVPIYTGGDLITSKFVYGLRTLLLDDFKISLSKVPYLKKLLGDFNGYSTSGNVIAEKKFNDILSYVGQATGYLYDLRFFNGLAAGQNDMLQDVRVPANALITFQEAKDPIKTISMIENANVIDSTFKVSEYVKTLSINPAEGMPAIASLGPNPRLRVIMVNILDMNIMPLNVHSLMREIPLVNIYNYAMTFDEIVAQLSNGTNPVIHKFVSATLRDPYARIEEMNGDLVVRNKAEIINIDQAINDTSLRFIGDILYKRVANRGVAGRELTTGELNARLNTKLVRNLMFLTMVQYAIKKKVKRELDYVNTRVVSSTAAVSDVITNATTDLGNVSDSMFEF